MLRRIGIVLGMLLLVAAALLGIGYGNALRDPVVRRATIALPDLPAGTPPVRLLLASDVHLGSAAMDAGRLARMIDRIAALRPDVVLLAGDFVSGHASGSATVAAPVLAGAFGRLRPRFGTFAVPGNHDHWTGGGTVRHALERAGVRVLVNRAATAGPLAIGGADDDYTGHARVAATLAAMRRIRGAGVLLSHSPDVAPAVRGGPTLVLAGHTHCGQIVLPLRGAITIPSRYGNRYLCGMVREGTRTTIVTAGLGTSVVPLRWGAPPDMWLLTLTRGR